MKQLFTVTIFLLAFVTTHAQVIDKTKEATGLRADGKIWVVMAVCLTILTGLFIYVISLDRKIAKLEKGK
ncbi:MAG: CcmD family protein [Chitinophagaceae bacterium]